MIYEPQNGTEELLMLAGRVYAFEDLLDAFESDSIPKNICKGIFGFRRKNDRKNNSAVSNNEVD